MNPFLTNNMGSTIVTNVNFNWFSTSTLSCLMSQISGVVVSGYAANNSRALERRRSSVSEYVLSQDEEEGSAGSSESRRRRKVRRHVLTQAVFSTTIGPAPTRLGAYWSRASECCLRQKSYVIKNQVVASKVPY